MSSQWRFSEAMWTTTNKGSSSSHQFCPLPLGLHKKMVQAEQGFQLSSTAGDTLDWPVGSETMREDLLWQPVPSHTTTAHSASVFPEFGDQWGFAQTTGNISFPSGWPDTDTHNRTRLTCSMYLKEVGHLEPNSRSSWAQKSVSTVPRMTLESKLYCLSWL